MQESPYVRSQAPSALEAPRRIMPSFQSCRVHQIASSSSS
jgi:hypothetical protein